jgi:hypothetical protein
MDGSTILVRTGSEFLALPALWSKPRRTHKLLCRAGCHILHRLCCHGRFHRIRG